MLQISNDAAALLTETRESEGVPDSYGVRIFGESDPDGRLIVRLTFADQPQEGDAVLEEQGTQVFVAQEVVQPLQDKVIDVDDEGDTSLVVRSQDEETS